MSDWPPNLLISWLNEGQTFLQIGSQFSSNLKVRAIAGVNFTLELARLELQVLMNIGN